MGTLADFLAIECIVLIGAFAAVVSFKILAGDINTKAMLDEKRLVDGKPSGLFSPARLQALVITLAVAFYIVTEVSISGDGLPDIPKEVLVLLFGSQLGYLGFKGKRVLFGVLST